MSFAPKKSNTFKSFSHLSQTSLSSYKLYKSAAMDSFDLKKLRDICAADSLTFGVYADLRPLPASKWSRGRDESGRFYYFKDNGANILAVAHLDSVQSENFCRIMKIKNAPKDAKTGEPGENGSFIFSPVLDDRLGAYTILELLPKLGCQFDILLTTDEEMGATTASDFDPSFHGDSGYEAGKSRYNWMFQFDRAGTDVVMYDYESSEHIGDLEDCGWDVGYGSYSDISTLQHLGCIGFNFGVAYRDYHSLGANVKLSDYFHNIARFMLFYAAHSDVQKPFDYSEHLAYNSHAFGYESEYVSEYRSFLDAYDRDEDSGYYQSGNILWDFIADDESVNSSQKTIEDMGKIFDWHVVEMDDLTASGLTLGEEGASDFSRKELKSFFSRDFFFEHPELWDYIESCDKHYLAWLLYELGNALETLGIDGHDAHDWDSIDLAANDKLKKLESEREPQQPKLRVLPWAERGIFHSHASVAHAAGLTMGDYYTDQELEDIEALWGDRFDDVIEKLATQKFKTVFKKDSLLANSVSLDLEAKAKLPTSYECFCGQTHEFSQWVYAHWNTRITTKCSKCGYTNTLQSGTLLMGTKKDDANE